jgi:predicted Fe-S protein YdhL (DUF1289 family)
MVKANRDELASPCVSICEMSASNGVCIGCFRTLDEIAAWSVLDAAAKRAIIEALPARRDSAGDSLRATSGASPAPLSDNPS